MTTRSEIKSFNMCKVIHIAGEIMIKVRKIHQEKLNTGIVRMTCDISGQGDLIGPFKYDEAELIAEYISNNIEYGCSAAVRVGPLIDVTIDTKDYWK